MKFIDQLLRGEILEYEGLISSLNDKIESSKDEDEVAAWETMKDEFCKRVAIIELTLETGKLPTAI